MWKAKSKNVFEKYNDDAVQCRSLKKKARTRNIDKVASNLITGFNWN